MDGRSDGYLFMFVVNSALMAAWTHDELLRCTTLSRECTDDRMFTLESSNSTRMICNCSSLNRSISLGDDDDNSDDDDGDDDIDDMP